MPSTPLTRDEKITVAEATVRRYADSTNYGKFLSETEAKHIATLVVDDLSAAEGGQEI